HVEYELSLRKPPVPERGVDSILAEAPYEYACGDVVRNDDHQPAEIGDSWFNPRQEFLQHARSAEPVGLLDADPLEKIDLADSPLPVELRHDPDFDHTRRRHD